MGHKPFRYGDRVECKVYGTKDQWVPGTITQSTRFIQRSEPVMVLLDGADEQVPVRRDRMRHARGEAAGR